MALSRAVAGASGPLVTMAARVALWRARDGSVAPVGGGAEGVRAALSRRKGCERPFHALGQPVRLALLCCGLAIRAGRSRPVRVRVALSCVGGVPSGPTRAVCGRGRAVRASYEGCEWPVRAGGDANGPLVTVAARVARSRRARQGEWPVCALSRVRVAGSGGWRREWPFRARGVGGGCEWAGSCHELRVAPSKRGLARAVLSRRGGAGGPFARLRDQREWPARAAKGASGPFARWRRAEWSVHAGAGTNGPFVPLGQWRRCEWPVRADKSTSGPFARATNQHEWPVRAARTTNGPFAT